MSFFSRPTHGSVSVPHSMNDVEVYLGRQREGGVLTANGGKYGNVLTKGICFPFTCFCLFVCLIVCLCVYLLVCPKQQNNFRGADRAVVN